MAVNELQITENQRLDAYSTFGIGGPARYFCIAKSIADLQKALKFAEVQQIPWFALGKGSNLLFDDLGFPGLVILNKLDAIQNTSPGIYHVEAGYSFARLGMLTAREGWQGLEFAAGIPASVGGAVWMNAGACGQETADTLLQVDHMNPNGELRSYQRSELSFAYRKSPFQSMPGIITAARFVLSPSKLVKDKQKQLIEYRTETQPYGEKSAGCMFRNPQGSSAGALIEAAGLKGFRIGGAVVSPKHANFIVNASGASSKDVLALIDILKEKVRSHCGAELECEVRYIPYQQSSSTQMAHDLFSR